MTSLNRLLIYLVFDFQTGINLIVHVLSALYNTYMVSQLGPELNSTIIKIQLLFDEDTLATVAY